MSNEAISKAIQRRIENPEIYQPVKRDSKTFNKSVTLMVLDLKEHVPSLSVRQISSIVGVGKTFVAKILEDTFSSDRWTEEDNAPSSAAELAALQKHHPGREYEDAVSAVLFDGSKADVDERSEVPVSFTTPLFADRYCRADQSHTTKRPITLATVPFSVAA